MLIVEFYPEHRARKHGLDAPFDFNVFFFHSLLGRRLGLLAQATPRRPAKKGGAKEKKEARYARAPCENKLLN